MKKYIWLVVVAMYVLAGCKQVSNDDNYFVKVKNTAFVINDQPYQYVGANYWQGMNLGAPRSGDRERLIKELDQLQAMGIKNLRVLAASEADSAGRYCIHPAVQQAPGVYNEEVLEGLDFFLNEMSKRDMKAVMVLGNFWTWSGGFPQYLNWAGAGDIPYPQDEEHSWTEFVDYSKQFYTNAKAQEMMNQYIEFIVSRTNTVNGINYTDDPTIMAWQLSNEPRGYDQVEVYQQWISKTARLIKQLDSNHLVSIGSEGNATGPWDGINVLEDNRVEDVDYITMHIWAQNWGWYTPGQPDSVYQEAIKKTEAYWDAHVAAAKELNKPLVLEEFGIARDGASFDVKASTTSRDQFYKYLLGKVETSIESEDVVCGVNFWSYTGSGRPPRPGEYWQLGDPFIGDPPHELQGWYGVYDTDTTTITIITDVATTVNKL
ncbi:glycoside hydrolase 5 family protein [Carboxylicivirga linearis]|uniref:mannan endo-1,4-beta-mannosidase n=1 Tax=Carboxylicivirga linearis TaxID=1628157 RepID=A0ABS5K0B7_9BACT|nr:cellulase family glycosylhydrolase [Carboxylicivirga linearis]MBS2100558.1 cellulase family glycosylhydrolase [Carboxylicivirga linearis]